MRVAVVGDGIAALRAASALAGAAGAEPTLITTTTDPHPADPTALEGACPAAAYSCPAAEPPLTGLLSRHGCPNLARWYDELRLSLGGCDAAAREVRPGGAAPAVAAAVRRRVGAAVGALLAAPGAPALEGSLGEFCAAGLAGDGAAARRWLVPLAAAVWAVPAAQAAAMPARLVLRVLFENGLLLAGGDGSGGGETWWQLRPRGGMGAVHRRARASLASRGVRVLCAPASELQVELDRAGGARVTVGGSELGRFDRVVLAAPPPVAAGMLQRGSAGSDQQAWVAALRKLAALALPMEQVIYESVEPLASWAPGAEGEWASCMVPGEAEGAPAVAYWLRSVRQESFGMESAPANGAEHFVCVRSRATDGQAGDGSMLQVHSAALRPGCGQLQQAVDALQGRGGVWYASALLSDGLHEGAVVAALRVVQALLPAAPVPMSYPVWRHRIHLRFAGRTTHRRPKGLRSAVAHSFSYSVRYDYVNVDAGFRRWWGGLVREDHFGDPAVDLGETVRQYVNKEIGVWPAGPVDFLGSLREWGYCFNPIGLYYCWATPERERLVCVVSAVTNTPWGQRSLHVLPVDPHPKNAQTALDDKSGQLPPSAATNEFEEIDEKGPANRRTVHQREKRLHVSPFNRPPDGEASWRYSLSTPTPALEKIYVGVSAFADAAQDRDMLQVAATLSLRRAAPRWLGCEWLRTPYSLLVQFRIHWQAALLLRKGLTFHSNTTCPLASSVGAISHGAMLALVAVAALVVALLVWACVGLGVRGAGLAQATWAHATEQ